MIQVGVPTSCIVQEINKSADFDDSTKTRIRNELGLYQTNKTSHEHSIVQNVTQPEHNAKPHYPNLLDNQITIKHFNVISVCEILEARSKLKAVL
jgi:hypothetical protein